MMVDWWSTCALCACVVLLKCPQLLYFNFSLWPRVPKYFNLLCLCTFAIWTCCLFVSSMVHGCGRVIDLVVYSCCHWHVGILKQVLYFYRSMFPLFFFVFRPCRHVFRSNQFVFVRLFVFVLKCKSENDIGVILTEFDRFQPFFWELTSFNPNYEIQDYFLAKILAKAHLNPIFRQKMTKKFPFWPNFATMWWQEFFALPFFICHFSKGVFRPYGRSLLRGKVGRGPPPVTLYVCTPQEWKNTICHANGLES